LFLYYDLWLCIVFFFQAEDGIRDFHVTGVQTCALPIYPDHVLVPNWMVLPDSVYSVSALDRILVTECEAVVDNLVCCCQRDCCRSEERRVGKECRYWWSSYH